MPKHKYYAPVLSMYKSQVFDRKCLWLGGGTVSGLGQCWQTGLMRILNVRKASEKPKLPVVHIAASYTSTVKVPASAKCNLCPQKMRSLSY